MGDGRGGYYPPDKVPLSEVGLIVEKEIATMNETYDAVSVDKFCIMPDHIHLLLVITFETSVSNVITVIEPRSVRMIEVLQK